MRMKRDEGEEVGRQDSKSCYAGMVPSGSHTQNLITNAPSQAQTQSLCLVRSRTTLAERDTAGEQELGQTGQ